MHVTGEPEVRPAFRAIGTGEIFQLLRDGRPRTRADLIAMTGLGRSTIGGRIDQLLESGLVTPAGGASSTGGRPPATFAFNPASHSVLAVDLGASHARLALTDLASSVLATHQAPLRIADGPQRVLDWVATEGSRLLGETGRTAADLSGFGVGLPGPV